MATKRTLVRQLADARAQIRRLADAREDAVGTAGTEHFNVVRLAKQLDEAREENKELRRQLATAAPGPGPGRIAWARIRQELRLSEQALRLSEQARASLDAQCRQLGRINEQQAAELYDRAEVPS